MASGANPAFYRKLAGILAIGIVVAIVLGLVDITGPGLLDLESSIVSLFLATFVIVGILLFFLLRVGDIFSIERKVQDLLAAEGAKWGESLQAEEAKADALRVQLKADADKAKNGLLQEQASQRMAVQDALTAANRAAAEARQAQARIEELARRPETSTEVGALRGKVETLEKELAEMRRRDTGNVPLLKQLQEDLAALRAGQTKLGHRVDSAVEAVERREMEASAARTELDHEVADLRKREQLLVLRSRDLESANEELQARARKPAVSIRPGDEKHHVLAIEGIGPKYASRLNAVGIITIPQLAQADPDEVANQLDVMPDLVREWQAMADLIRVKGVGPQSAEVLVRAGVKSVAQLATLSPEEVSQKVKETEAGRKVRIQGQDVSPGVAKRWVEAARKGEMDE